MTDMPDTNQPAHIQPPSRRRHESTPTLYLRHEGNNNILELGQKNDSLRRFRQTLVAGSNHEFSRECTIEDLHKWLKVVRENDPISKQISKQIEEVVFKSISTCYESK